MNTPTTALSVLLVLVAGACSDSGGSSSSNTTQTIGAAGGTIAVSSGALNGMSVTVPPNALTADREININDATATAQSGLVVVSPAAILAPAGTIFSTPAMLVMPITASLIPPGRTIADVLLKRADTAGNITDLTVTARDATASTVTAQLPGFSTVWAISPATPFATLFRLQDGDSYSYNDGSTLAISVGAETLPGLPNTVLTKLTFDFPDEGVDAGVWLSTFADGSTQRHGSFDTEGGVTSYEVHNPQLFAPTYVINGERVVGPVETFQGYQTPNTQPSYSGATSYEGVFTGPMTLTVPAGTFQDVFRWQITDTITEGNQTETSQATLWLAPLVGPVQYQFPGANAAQMISTNVTGG